MNSNYKYYKRRRYRRKKPYCPPLKKPPIYKIADYAVNGYRLAKRLATVLNVEKKYHDIDQSGLSIDWFGNLGTANQISQGDSDITRDGDSIKMMNLTVRGYFISGSFDCSCRFMIILDKQNNISTVGDLVSDNGTNLATLSSKVYDKRFRSKVLYDKVVQLSADNPRKQFSVVIPILKHTQFNAGTTNIESGALKFLHISDQDPTAITLPVIRYKARLTYVDN